MIPKHEEIRVPALELLAEGNDLLLREFEAPLASAMGLSQEEVGAEYESGNGRIFYDRISWALSYMYAAGLVEKPKRGLYRITAVGRQLMDNADELNEYVKREYQKRKTDLESTGATSPESSSDGLTPQEELYESAKKIRESVYLEILDTILRKTPREFEKLVVELLQCMGYGGEVEDAGIVTQYTNDGGIDGVIKEDVLGLGRIHIQAKRYAQDSSIGREDIQKFVGALAVAQSNKGVFITTSSYSKGARGYAESLSGTPALVLIDGSQLAEFIYNYGLGMQVEQTIQIKRLDSEYWDSMDDQG